MTECQWCESKFEVLFDDEDSELLYCPACGEELYNHPEETNPEYWDDDPDGGYWDDT